MGKLQLKLVSARAVVFNNRFSRGMMGGMMGGVMGGMIERMSAVSMSIGLVGQGVQMLGMNTEVIQSTFTGLIQLLAQTSHSINELAGCPSDQSTGASTGMKLDQHTGQMVPKNAEELLQETVASAKRRRTARWLVCLAAMCYAYWNLKQRILRARAARELLREFTGTARA
jgi:predicted lipid-binding transport protein (Tim44 family)